MMDWDAMRERAVAGGGISRAEALQLLDLPTDALPLLLDSAFAARRAHKGMRVGIQLLTNARSGDCSQNCAYCAQSREAEGANVQTYDLVDYGLLERDGDAIAEEGLARHCIGLSGIRFSDAEIEGFARHVEQLKRGHSTPICCSIGFLTERQALRLKEAGVDRINHNLNTSRRHYPNICTTHSWDERLANIRMLQSLGFEICCGGILGMGETAEDVADLFLAIGEVAPQAVPVNFLLPQEGTRLAGADTSHLTPEYCLKALCLARLALPRADIRCAAGREVYLRGHEREVFMVADSIFASGYLTAGGQCVEDAVAQVEAAGFEALVTG
jgi:biotin synthase